MTGILTSRLAKGADVPMIAHWLIGGMMFLPHVKRALPRLLDQLISNEQIKVLLIEEHALGSGNAIVRGVGISGFVYPSVFDARMATADAFPFGALLNSFEAGVATFLRLPEIGRANVGAGVDLVVEYMQADWDLSVPLWRAVVTIAHEAYVKHHRGYRLRRALQEFWTAHADVYLPAGYRALRSFELDRQQLSVIATPFGSKRTLCYADGSGAPGQTVSNAFQYQEPRCGFTLLEQRVLLRAVDGLTDAEIAQDLQTTPNSVKQTWKTIYERVQLLVPSVLAADQASDSEGRRGREKRRHVIGYVDKHPSELRPFFRERRVAPPVGAKTDYPDAP